MIDQKIGRIHNIITASECFERGATFVFTCHKTWGVSVTCHTSFEAESDGPADLETAVARLLQKVIEGHREKSPVAA